MRSTSALGGQTWKPPKLNIMVYDEHFVFFEFDFASRSTDPKDVQTYPAIANLVHQARTLTSYLLLGVPFRSPPFAIVRLSATLFTSILFAGELLTKLQLHVYALFEK